jgi:hypothetical protein
MNHNIIIYKLNSFLLNIKYRYEHLTKNDLINKALRIKKTHNAKVPYFWIKK